MRPADPQDDLDARLARLIDHHLQHGVLPAERDIAPDRPDLVAPLLALARRYLALAASFDGDTVTAPAGPGAARPAGDAAFAIPGFRTIERIGGGGMGEVYKLEDLQLGRIVAAKVIRADARSGRAERLADFVREARSLALFSDPRIVQIFDYRADVTPPVLIMEFVDGFELGKVGPSLEFRQRAAILRDVCDAIDRAHALGLTHRDLKPSNIMLDGQLRPKILDFGLSGQDPSTGHFRGTLHYIAPEQIDPSRPIDARTDVYALGVVLYELLTGAPPNTGASQAALLDAVRAGRPRLPIEVAPRVPPGLQAIALKAMERQPADRYPSAREMALDLDRYLDGRPVAARPSQLASTLRTRVGPHLDQIEEWQRLRLIYPHEAERLRAEYRRLDAPEDDWIVASRALTGSKVALYLGAFFLFAGGLFYFVAHRVYDAAAGILQPFVVLAVPFLGVNVAGRWLYRRDHQAVAVAFLLAGVSLLPLFLLIWFQEAHLFRASDDAAHELFDPDGVSNRQLQITIGASAMWAGWLAWRTKTAALSTVSALLVFLLALAVLGDFGLRSWLEDERYDLVALHLAPLVPIYALAGLGLDRAGRAWFARPLYVGAGLSLVLVLDLVALDGRAFEYLRVSLRALQPEDVSRPALLDTLAALTLNGVLFYAVAAAVDRHGTDVMRPAAQFLLVIAPFSMLEPLAVLSETQEYSARVDWLYLGAAVAIAVLSQARQRKSFYYAGLVNSGVALYLIALRREWFDQPSWAVALVTTGLVTLAGGFLLDARARRRHPA